MIFQTRAGDYRKMGTEQCADGVTFTFQCPKELACAVVLFEKKTGKQAAKIDVLPQYRVGSVRSVTIYPLKAEKYYYCYEIEGKRVRILFVFQMKNEYSRTIFIFSCRDILVRCLMIPFHETETLDVV